MVRHLLFVVALLVSLAGFMPPASAAAVPVVPIAQSPLATPSQVPNNMVLVPSVEWPTVVTQANDPGVAETSSTYSATPNQSCPSGYTLNGSSCQKSVVATGSCAVGYTLNASAGTCTQTASPATSVTYSCPNNYTPTTGVTSTTICQRTTNNNCRTGYTKTGGVCSGPAIAGTTSYSCPSGYTLSGTGSATSCTKTGSAPTYSCPTGATSSGTGTNTICVTDTQTPTVTGYAGYFNPGLCYAYHYDSTYEANRYFYPVTPTGTGYSCAGKTGGTPSQSLWSGNFMNWVSMQAIDTFRLALTGGYRVNLPGEGTPPRVTVGSGTKATGDQPGTTYLEKATSDRWASSYTQVRSLAGNITDATPSQATVSGSYRFRTRIGALRNQMWFIPYSNTSNADLGNAESYSSPYPLALPVTNGVQTDPDPNSTGIAAIPYDPSVDTLPNSNTSYTCPNGGTLSGSTCGAQTMTTCPTADPYYKTTTQKCQVSSTNSSSYSGGTLCPATWTLPTSSGTGKTCSLASYAGTVSAYGRNQIYAVSIRVKVCDGTWDTRADLCTKYGSNYKPEGLLQKNSINTRYSLFSYLVQTGGDPSNRPGGVMRARQKLIGPVTSGEQPYPLGHLPSDSSATGVTATTTTTSRIAGVDNPEWDLATGVFINNPDSSDAATTSTNIGGCGTSDTPDGSSCVIRYSGVINYLNRFGELGVGTGLATPGYTASLKSNDTLSEMYYTALRYLRGLGNVSAFSDLTTTPAIGSQPTGVTRYQNADGLPVIDDWYGTGSNNTVTQWSSSTTVGKTRDPMLYQCQNTVVLGIGDTATQQEDDTYSSDTSTTGTPGTSFASVSSTTMTNWKNATDATSGGAQLDTAGLAYWAHMNDLRPDIPNTPIASTASDARGQSISTYWVDVVELANLKTNTTNQYYNATKYGGFKIPDSFYTGNGGNGNATPPANANQSGGWFDSNMSTWTTATQTVGAANPSLSNGNFYQPSNMFLGNNGSAMVAGLNAAFTKIAADVEGSGASLAANSTQLGTGTTTYQAVYYSGNWRGDLLAYRVCTGNTSVTGCATQSAGSIATSPAWRASSVMPSADSRQVYTCKPPTAGGACTTAVQLTKQTSTTLTLTPALDTATQNALCANSSSCAAGEQAAMVNYLLGIDSSNGISYRTRTTPLGDIVDSQPVYVGFPSAAQYSGKSFASAFSTYASTASVKGRKNVIYVASNDGMLHGFYECTLTSTGTCTTTTPAQGQELFAYLPNAVIKSGLAQLAQPGYGGTIAHSFFNDGELVVADVQCSSGCPNAVNGWATVLVGTTGRGPAKAVYALDVTNPDSIALLWERSAGDGGTNSGYMGQFTGKPVIARVPGGSWAVLMGNGYNSAQNTPALLQFDIASGNLSVYTTTGITGDGLAPPAVWISDSTVADNISTQAYAGDLNGNVWAFNLAATGGSGSSIFTAQSAGPPSAVQPITAGMVVAKNPTDNSVWIFFGTGSVLNSFQVSDGQSNTWYGLIVQSTLTTAPAIAGGTRANLVQRSVIAENAATSTSLAVRGISSATSNDMSGKSGWYLDLPDSGERMVTPNQFQGSLLLGTSRVPSSGNSDPCNPSGGSGWIMSLSPFTGVPPVQSFFDANGNGVFTDDYATTTAGTQVVAAGVGYGAVANNPIFVGQEMLISFSNATTGSTNTRGTISALKRLSWRELTAP